MNKKFSTLAVALLAAGAFVGTANAQSKLGAQTDVKKGNVYYLSTAANATSGDPITSYVKGKTNGTTTDVTVTGTFSKPALIDEPYFQWIVEEVGTGASAQYKLKNVATGKYYAYDNGTTVKNLFTSAELFGYSTGAAGNPNVYNIDARELSAYDLNNQNAYSNSFSLQFMNPDDHSKVLEVAENPFTKGKIVARDAGAAFYTTVHAGQFTASGELVDAANSTIDLNGDGTNDVVPSDYEKAKGVLLQVDGEWDGSKLFDIITETVKIDGTSTVRDCDYLQYYSDQVEKFRASKFIVLSEDRYSQYATDVTGDAGKGYKYEVVTGAELMANGTRLVDVAAQNAPFRCIVPYTFMTYLNIPSADPKIKANYTSANVDELPSYIVMKDLESSVVRPYENAVFTINKKGTSAADCVNDLEVILKNAYLYSTKDGKSVYTLCGNKGTAADATASPVVVATNYEGKPLFVNVFNFTTANYVGSAQDNATATDPGNLGNTHIRFVKDALVGVLVDPKEFLKNKTVNVTYYTYVKDNNVITTNRRGGEFPSAAENYTWSPNGAEDVLKENVDYSVPEGQWLINYNPDNNTFAFVNKESTEIMPTPDETNNLSEENLTNGKNDWIGYTIYDNGDGKYTATGTTVWRNGETVPVDLYLTIAKADEGEGIMNGYLNYPQDSLDNGFHISVLTDLFGKAYMKENHESNHQISMATEPDASAVWRLFKYDRAKDYAKNIEGTDTVLVINPYTAPDFQLKWDTVAAVSYSIINDLTKEALDYDYTKKAYFAEDTSNYYGDWKLWNLPKYVLKSKTYNGKKGVIILPADVQGNRSSASAWRNYKLYGAFSDNKVCNNENGEELTRYDFVANDLFAVENIKAPLYRSVEVLDTVKIYRDENNSEFMYENGHFLDIEHIADVPKMKAAMYVDTAYVRNNPVMPQYLLAVGADHKVHREECTIPGHPVHQTDTVYGRFLVNMVDSMFTYGYEMHNNPYKFDEYPKLAFVEGYHAHDSLSLPSLNKSIDLSKNVINLGVYAFRYTDREAGSFIIETATRTSADVNKAIREGKTIADAPLKTGYIKWLNGTPVVVSDIAQAEVFNMAKTSETPTANEGINADEVSIQTIPGAVIVKNAAGKTVTVSNILGKTIASQVLTSDNETIAAPAGIVVVAVEGSEAVKAVVK